MDLSQLHQEAKIQLLVNASLDEFRNLTRLNKDFNQLAYLPPTSERVFQERSEKYFPQFIQFKDLDKSLLIPEKRRYYYSENMYSLAGLVRRPMSWQEFYKRMVDLFRNLSAFSIPMNRNIGYTWNNEVNAANNLIAENKLMEVIILANMPKPIHPGENAIFYTLANANMEALNYLYANHPGLFVFDAQDWGMTNYLIKTMQSNSIEIFKRAREINPFPIRASLLFYEHSPKLVEYLLQNYPELELAPREDINLAYRIKKLRQARHVDEYASEDDIDRAENYAHEHDKLVELAKLFIRYNKMPASSFDF